LPFAANALDTALTIRVLHHIADIPKAFAEIARIVRPHGTYLTDFANKRHLKALLKHHLGRSNGMDPYSLDPYEFVELNFDYHPGYITNNLNQVGFQIRAERAVSTFRIGGVKRVVPTSILVSADGVLQRVSAPLQIAPSIFFKTEAMKPGDAKLNPALWRCVKCHADKIKVEGGVMKCGACAARFEQSEGIWEMKI
jgi:SAM-dependent methyltransferase